MTDALSDREARGLAAAALRLDGWSYAEIASTPFPCAGDGQPAPGATRLYASPAAARRGVARVLAAAAEDADTMRRVQAARLDRLVRALMERALGGDGPAIDRVLALETRRARLFALDRPEEAAAAPAIDPRAARAELAERLDRLARALAGHGAGEAGPPSEPPAGDPPAGEPPAGEPPAGIVSPAIADRPRANGAMAPA